VNDGPFAPSNLWTRLLHSSHASKRGKYRSISSYCRPWIPCSRTAAPCISADLPPFTPTCWSDARVATLDASGVRDLLAAHFRYYARTGIDPTSIQLQVDDPRRLWEAIDAAVAVPGLAERRHALHNALAVAVEAVARHHGIGATSRDAALAWLTLLTAKEALPATTRDIIHMLNGERASLVALYSVVPRDLERHKPAFDGMVAALERVALLLQERDPYQVTDKDLRRIGLANLLR